MRIILVLCEGPHDVVFMSRLLKADGYVKYKNPLRQFPQPLDKWFSNISKNLRIEDLRLDRMNDNIKAVLPSAALHNPDREHLVLLYSMNGDAQKEKREKIISDLMVWTQPPKDEKEFSLMEENVEAGNDYGLIVVFDADEHGVNSRIVKARSDLSKFFPIANTIAHNGEIVADEYGIKIGIYIFADAAKQTGTLEDLLLPIMKLDNEQLFDNAESFLRNNYDESRLQQLILKKHPTKGIIEKRDKPNKYYPIKSLIGVVGQLQISGASNTVCIEKADYITLDKIKSSHICQDILRMFSCL